MAQLYCHGRAPPEWPAAYLDRLVYAASATLVSCFCGLRDAGSRTGAGWDVISAATLAHRMLLYRDSLELGVILTANYTFLNYLVLALGVLLLDDRFLQRFLPQGILREQINQNKLHQSKLQRRVRAAYLGHAFRILKLSFAGVMLSWIFYATSAELIWMFAAIPLPTAPVAALEPSRIANRYGLFGIMTRGRYEIEFQGSDDGKTCQIARDWKK